MEIAIVQCFAILVCEKELIADLEVNLVEIMSITEHSVCKKSTLFNDVDNHLEKYI